MVGKAFNLAVYTECIIGIFLPVIPTTVTSIPIINSAIPTKTEIATAPA